MMYTPLKLYYLNQMGLTPWIHKDQANALNVKHQTTQELKLIVLSPPNQSQKAQLLLNRIMDFIRGLELQFVWIESESFTQLQHQLLGSHALAILDFGTNLGLFLKELNLECPVFSNPDPEFLLKNLAFKKKIFEDLLLIQAIHSKYSP